MPEIHIESDNQIYSDDKVPETKLHVRSGVGSISPMNPLEIVFKPVLDPILTVTATHNILIGTCVVTGDYQFVISGHETSKTTMTPEEYQTINAVIERAVSTQ